jgi:hypothetical protein
MAGGAVAIANKRGIIELEERPLQTWTVHGCELFNGERRFD